MSAPGARVSTRWLALREPADAVARAPELADALARAPRPVGGWVIHDLGAGTGSMGRWLAPHLPGPQRWIAHDQDADLLAVAADRPGRAGDGAKVTVEPRHSDISRLEPDDFAGASLVTASALLDMMTADELTGLITACAGAGCPLLLTLTVVGRVSLVPEDPLDRRVAGAFNDHQRRPTERGRLLGPDAGAAAVAQLLGRGREVVVRPSPWRLGASHAALIEEWLGGWVAAASEQQTELAEATDGYMRRRLEQARAGQLTVTVEHIDLLALP